MVREGKYGRYVASLVMLGRHPASSGALKKIYAVF